MKKPLQSEQHFTVPEARWLQIARSHLEPIPESVRMVLLVTTHLFLLGLYFHVLTPLASFLRALSERMAAKISV